MQTSFCIRLYIQGDQVKIEVSITAPESHHIDLGTSKKDQLLMMSEVDITLILQ
jgi:hypothetical protein